MSYCFMNKSFLQQSLKFQKGFYCLNYQMLLDTFQHSFSVDQQKKIMHQIQVINKKLNSNPYSVKHLQPKQQIKSQRLDERYFSEQCEQLFNDQNYPLTMKAHDSFNNSLFSSKNSLLLDNQYEKQVKNFKEFQTDKYSSQCRDKLIFGKYQQTDKDKILQAEVLKNQFAKKTKFSQISTEKTGSQSQIQSVTKLIPNTKSKSRIKSIAQSKIKKYIENKQNILPASNMQQSYIKQVRKKIRFQTQPDCYLYDQQLEEDSLESQRIGQFNQSVNSYSRSKNKYNSNKNTLQCTFKPNILKKSSQIADMLQPSFERLTQDISISKCPTKQPYKAKQQLSTRKYSMSRLQQMSQPRKLKTLADNEEPKYDFRPSLSKKSLQQMANCTMDVASRNQLWLQQRQVKMTKLKIQEGQKKLKQQMGSYAPKITPYKGEKQVHLSRYAKEGISSYFQRVSMAKQKHQTQQKKKPQPKEQMKESNVNMKKKTYDEAVRELHKKIMAINL